MPTLLQNIGLSNAATGGQTSGVGEPSVSNNADQILLTGNWFASRSLDHGATWLYTSPFNFFPPVDGGFCCDQTTIYDPGHDLRIWLLQYVKLNNTNTLRIAVQRGADLGSTSWYWWDLQPVGVNPQWQGEWFDYNHAVLSDSFLNVATNAFRFADNVWTRSVVFRLPLDVLATGGTLQYNYFQSTTNFSLRCTAGAGGTLYFASHNSNQQIRLFTWPESSNQVSQVDIGVSPWLAGVYSAPGPDGNDWLGRCDPRITGGWVANGVIGFLWSANRATNRPFPYIRAVRLDEASKHVLDEPDIWNASYAYAYPEACPNDQGQVGITLFRGGGARHPGHVVGVRDEASQSWLLAGTRDGTNGPLDNKWGDYLTCRKHRADGSTWLATGFTLQGGSTRGFIEPRLVHFGA
jgi:hypothetical protein